MRLMYRLCTMAKCGSLKKDGKKDGIPLFPGISHFEEREYLLGIKINKLAIISFMVNNSIRRKSF